jgi:hypothetical protein
MGFFDDAYDEMSWQEVSSRLPSELAVSALKRRITNLDTLKMFFDSVAKQPNSVIALKDHINQIVSDAKLDDIFNLFDETYHPRLFNWLGQDNIDRIKNHDPDQLSIKFLFNITKSDDKESLCMLLNRVLTNDEDYSYNYVRSILGKSDDKCLAPLVDMIIKDKRPSVRAMVLAIPGLSNNELVGDHHKVIGLKAFAKCNHNPLDSINMLDINIFKNLRPLERLNALEKYLSFFPLYKRVKVFNPEPTEEDFQFILFAGCIEHNERVEKIHNLYNQITSEDPPHQNDEDDDA